MAGHSLPVARVDKEAVDLVLDLQRNTTSVGDNDWATSVESLRHLDLEALASRELQNHMGVGQERVDELIVGVQAHDADILDQVRIVSLELAHGLVVDQAGIGVIDGAVAADDQLGNVGDACILAAAAELGVRVNDGGNTLGGIESRNLDDVLASRPVELSPTSKSASSKLFLVREDLHALRVACNIVNVAIVTRIPLVEMLVQAVKPISRSRKVHNLLAGARYGGRRWESGG